jgi:type 1 glutamine amidotransferase
MKTGWKWSRRLLVAVIVGALLAAGYAYWQMRAMGFLREPVFETERPAVPALQRPSMLVFSKTNSFIHEDAIPAAKRLLQDIAGARGWGVFVSDSGAVFNAGDLAKFDVVVWNNVTGDVLLPEQREAFRAWLEQGGGYIGLHAAGDNSHAAWPWYVDTVIRAHFIGHPMDPQFQQATLRIEQPADPIMDGIPAAWVRTDEWYSFAASPRASDLRVLATIDENTYRPGSFFGKQLAMGADHPMVWKQCVGRGRVFYAAPGHTAETYAEPPYRAMLERALDWAGRQDPALVSPAPLACEP